jgi:hypothetical protein
MRRRLGAALLFPGILAISAVLAASEEALVGKWSGDYEGGGGAGKYVITLGHNEAKKLAGTLEVLPGGVSAYTVPFKSVEPKGNSALLKYDSPEGNAEVHLDITVDGTALKGVWKAIDPASNTVVAEGTLTGTKG